jgi:hypothetical protein
LADEPSLRELKNLIERNHADAREDYIDLKAQVARDMANVLNQMQQFLLREVFEAKEAAMLQRIATLEEAAKTARQQVRGAVMAAVGSIVATILAAIILSVLLKGGKP